MKELINEVLDFMELNSVQEYSVNLDYKHSKAYLSVIFFKDNIRCERKIFEQDTGLVVNILIRQFEQTKNIIRANTVKRF